LNFLIRPGFWRRGFRLRGLIHRGLLKVLEGLEGAEEHTIGGFDSALKAAESFERILITLAERRMVLEVWVGKFGAAQVLVERFELVSPELGLDAAETALGPLGGDESIDESKLRGVGRLVVLEECGLEGIEFLRVFTANDMGEGVDAGLESILRADGFAFGGNGTGGFLRIPSIGFDLCL